MSLFKIVFLWLIAFYAAAQDDTGLYDETAPPGSTFIRVINTVPASLTTASVDNISFGAVNECNASGYVFVPWGRKQVVIDDKTIDYSFHLDHFYSVVKGSNGLVVIEDPKFKNKRKAMVTLYNLASVEPIKLTAKNGAVDVVVAVEKNALNTREINPLRIPMQIYRGENRLLDVAPMTLSRGNVFSALYCGQKNNAVINLIKSKMASQ